MAHNFLRGHEIEFVDEKGRRSCGHCGKDPTPEGHDACFGTLPGVKNACCGHGQLEEAYVQFWDRPRLAGQDAMDYVNDVGDSRANSFSHEGRGDFNTRVLAVLVCFVGADALDLVAPLHSWEERVQEGLDELCEQGLVTTGDGCFYKLAEGVRDANTTTKV